MGTRTENKARSDDLRTTVGIVVWMVMLSALAFGMASVLASRMESWESRKEGPSAERVTASGPVTTIEVQGAAGLVCIAYPGLVMHRASLDGDKVTVVIDEAALGVADANGCPAGTRGVVDERRWDVWKGTRRR